MLEIVVSTKAAEGAAFSFPKWGLYAALAVVLILLFSLLYYSRKKRNDRGEESEGVLLSEEERQTEGMQQPNQMQPIQEDTGNKTQREEMPEKTVKTGTETILEAEEGRMPEPVKKSAFTVSKLHEIGARADQQDSFGVSDILDAETYEKKGLLAVVADGMGGLSNGGEVSSLAVRACHNTFYSLPSEMDVPDMLVELAKAASHQVNQFLWNGQRSGSTLVSAIIKRGYLYFLTIGDSRIYLYRNGGLIQLNREHIYREELMLQALNGVFGTEQAENDPQAKSLTSYLGGGKIPHFDRNPEGIRLIKNDRILLASDGVFGVLTPEQLENAMAFPMEEIAEKLKTMVELKNSPYQDNYTALILEYRG